MLLICENTDIKQFVSR